MLEDTVLAGALSITLGRLCKRRRSTDKLYGIVMSASKNFSFLHCQSNGLSGNIIRPEFKRLANNKTYGVLCGPHSRRCACGRICGLSA